MRPERESQRTPRLAWLALIALASAAPAPALAEDEPPATAAAEPALDWSKTPPLGPEHAYVPPAPTRVELEGGGALLVASDHTLPLATVEISILGAGSAADPPDRLGLAAFTANLVDEGAGGRSARDLAEAIEGLGTELSIWVDEDAAHLRVSGLSEKMPESLALVGKMITSPDFNDADARRVHQDQEASIRLRRDRPGAVARIVLEARLFGAGSPYGHPATGHLQDLARIQVEDARAFYRARWLRAGLVAVVAGDLSAPRARELLTRALEGWTPAGEPAPSPPPGFATRGPRLLTIDRPGAEQANLLLGSPGLPRSDPRSFALDVAVNILGGTYGARLNRSLREKLGYTYGVYSDTSFSRTAGVFSIMTDVFTPKAAASIAEILRLCGELGGAPLPAADLAAAQANLIRGLPTYFDSNENVADALSSLVALGLPGDWFSGYADRIRAVTAAEVREVARAVFAPARLVVVAIGPTKTIGRALSRLKLGPPSRHDPDGRPMRR